MKKMTIWKPLTLAMALTAPAVLAENDVDKTSLKTRSKEAGRDVNDGMITTKVKAKLATMKGVRASDIRVDTNDGVVSLSGMVGSADQKQEAERAIRSLENVRSVRNMLQVGTAAATTTGDDRSIAGYGDREGPGAKNTNTKSTEATGSDLEDMRLSAAVKMRLLTASEVPATDINVDVSNKVVYLFGMVPTEATKKAAEAEAKKADGVTRIENQLQVVATNKMETVTGKDSDIQRDINLRLKDRAELKDVETVVEGGMVRIKGKVHSQWEQINALRLVRTVPGVKGVQNLLEVDEKDTEKRPSDRRN